MAEAIETEAEFYAVFSLSSKPVQISRSACCLPHPFPSMVAVFVLSSKPANKHHKLRATIINQEDHTQSWEIGSIDKDHRAFCWQPCHTKNFPIPQAQGQHSYQLHIGTDAELKRFLEDLKLAEEETTTMESSQTESQEVTNNEMLPEADRTHTSASPRTSRSKDKAAQNEETPQLQVQSPLSRPPHLSHSSSKKRKAQRGEGDDATPPTTRKRQSSRQKPSPATTSPLSSKVTQSSQKKQGTQKPSQTSVSKRDSSNSGPSPRWGHTLCDVGHHRSILIGGQGHKQAISKDSIWMLDTETSTWNIPPIVACSDKFPSRMGHTATFDPNIKCVFVFGGSKNLRWFSDMHVLDLDTWRWSHIEAAGLAPTRAYHSCNIFRNELYIFGGVYPNTDPEPDGCSNDVFIYNPESESWYQPVTMGTKPKQRSGHSATLLGDKLVIFGGWDAPICYNDLHILDLCLMEFTCPEVTGKPPSPRSWHASIALPNNKVLIHGGYNGNEALADAFIFDLDTYTWSQVELQSDVSVGIRAGHTITCCHDNQSKCSGKENELHGNTLALFGGGDNEDNFFDDLVQFTIK